MAIYQDITLDNKVCVLPSHGIPINCQRLYHGNDVKQRSFLISHALVVPFKSEKCLAYDEFCGIIIICIIHWITFCSFFPAREVLRGTYYMASLMAHSCIVNAQISISNDSQMTIKATVPIREGSMQTITLLCIIKLLQLVVLVY